MVHACRLCGERGAYDPLVSLARRASVPLFRAWGDHHMLHHHPHESAWSVYTSLD
jgi:hypothetical protein